MDEPIEHARFDRTSIERMRRMTPSQRLDLAASLTETALYFARAQGRPLRPRSRDPPARS